MIAVCRVQGLLSLSDGAACIKGQPRQSLNFENCTSCRPENNKFRSTSHHSRPNFRRNFEVHRESAPGWRGHYQSVKVGWRPAIKWEDGSWWRSLLQVYCLHLLLLLHLLMHLLMHLLLLHQCTFSTNTPPPAEPYCSWTHCLMLHGAQLPVLLVSQMYTLKNVSQTYTFTQFQPKL